MKETHSLLRRQLKKFFQGPEGLPETMKGFIDAINEAYYEFDTDREMLERALDLSSQELIHANAEMRAVFLALPIPCLRSTKTAQSSRARPRKPMTSSFPRGQECREKESRISP